MKKSAIIYWSILGATGLILIVVSMAGYGYFPPLIRSQVFKNLDLADTETEGYKNFVSKNRSWYYNNHIHHRFHLVVVFLSSAKNVNEIYART